LRFQYGNTYVADMETQPGSHRIDAEEATASLISVKDTRRRAQRADYPVWFWLGTGTALALVPLWIGEPWLTEGLERLLSLASMVIALAVGLACYRVRRVRERASSAGTAWQLGAVFGPTVAVMLAGGITWHNGLWRAPAAPLVTAAAVFVVVVGIGLATTDRPTRR
jgi:hypothetical protein